MGRAWDDAVDREFALRIRKIVAAAIKDNGGRDGAWKHGVEDIGKDVWSEVSSTYGIEAEDLEELEELEAD